MSQPRYQIFVSSTFRDLQDERQAVLNAILKLNQFPAGMEIFPAVNDTAWEHIEKVIEDSDYYVLIIGGKYGSIEEESGISYTEKEYDFAVSKNIPVLAFTHSDEESIPFGKVEKSEEAREKLKKFKQKVGAKHHWNYWKNIDELKANVLSSLSMAFVMNPQIGWVKAGGINNTELLSRLAELQKRYDELLEENNIIKDSALFFDTEKFLQADDPLKIDFFFNEDDSKSIDLTCNQILFGIGQNLVIQCEINDIKNSFGRFLLNCFKNSDEFKELTKIDPDKYKSYFKVEIYSESLQQIEIQLQVLEIINVSSVLKQSSSGLFTSRAFSNNSGSIRTYIEKTWQLTEKGLKLFLNQKALKLEQSNLSK